MAGPAAQRLRAAATRRRGLPRSILWSASLGVGLVALYVALYLVLRPVRPRLALGMVELFAFTVAAGRETAILQALEGPDPMPASVVWGLSVMDDVGSLLMAIAAVWLLRDTLQRFPTTGGWFLDLEKQALRHQATVRRWGMLGVLALFFMPGLGSGGTLGAAALGVLAQMRIRRLALWLAATAVVVDTFWVLTLRGILSALPVQPGWLGLVPLAVVAVAVAASLVDLARNRRHRHVVVLSAPSELAPEHQRRLTEWGIEHRGSHFTVDTLRLASFVGSRPRLALRHIASLLRLDGMTPMQAALLHGWGVVGLHSLSRLEPAMVGAALAEAGAAVDPDLAARWRDEAAAYASLEDAAWRS